MNPGYIKLLRWLTIATALVMMVIFGHYWNVRKVALSILILYDLMLLLLSLCLLAMIMTDAGEKRKNINAIVFLIAGVLSLFFVFS